MKRLIVSESAERDSAQAFLYVAGYNSIAAERLSEELGIKLLWLAETEFTGTPQEKLRAGMRSYVFRSWRVFYTMDKDRLTVLRIFHQRQDVSADDF